MQKASHNLPKVLLVDDEPLILQALKRQLQDTFEIEVANDATRALEKLEADSGFQVVVTDMRMPGVDGITFLNQLNLQHSEIKRIMLTGCREQEIAKRAVNEGQVFSFITKPCSTEEIANSISAAVQRYEFEQSEKALLSNTLGGCIRVLTEILSITDPRSFGNGLKIRENVRVIARNLIIPNSWEIELAAMLTPIGLMAVPPEILAKQRSASNLSAKEIEIIEKIPEFSRKLLEHIPRLESVANITYYLNKNFDGSGFPIDRIKQEEIPLGSRILRILSDYESELLTQGSIQGAFRILLGRKGKYDVQLLNQVFSILRTHCPESQDGTNPVILELPLSELRIGQIVIEDVKAPNGTVLVTGGTVLTQILIDRLNNIKNYQGLSEPLKIQGPSESTEQS